MKTIIKIQSLLMLIVSVLSCEDNRDSSLIPISTFTDEISQFEEPTLFVSETNPLEITVSPFAINAVEFDVLFGDEVDDTPLTIKAGEILTHVYPRGGDYTIKYVAKSRSGSTAEVSKVINLGSPFDPPLQLDFSSADGFFAFGVNFSVTTNPFLSGTNTEATEVGVFDKSNAAFKGIGYESRNAEGEAESIIDFTGPNKKVNMKVYSTIAVPVALIFQGPVTTDRGVEVVVNHSGSGWEMLSFDYEMNGKKEFQPGASDNGAPLVANDKFTKFVMFINGPSADAGVFYIDDLIQEDQQ